MHAYMDSGLNRYTYRHNINVHALDHYLEFSVHVYIPMIHVKNGYVYSLIHFGYMYIDLHNICLCDKWSN